MTVMIHKTYAYNIERVYNNIMQCVPLSFDLIAMHADPCNCPNNETQLRWKVK